MKIVLVLPLPNPGLQPNARIYHLKRAQLVKVERQTAFCIALDWINGHRVEKPRLKSATVNMRFYFKDKRRRDRDNLIGWTKFSRDGLTDAGIWIDDNVVRIGSVETFVDEKARLEMEISPNDEEIQSEL